MYLWLQRNVGNWIGVYSMGRTFEEADGCAVVYAHEGMSSYSVLKIYGDAND